MKNNLHLVVFVLLYCKWAAHAIGYAGLKQTKGDGRNGKRQKTTCAYAGASIGAWACSNRLRTRGR